MTNKYITKSILGLMLVASIFFSQCTSEVSYSLDDKIGQMLLVGFRGSEVEDMKDLLHELKEVQPGGVIFYDYDVPSQTYDRNIESPGQLKKLIHRIDKTLNITPFLAIDHEGGKVNRLKEKYGFPKTVSAGYLGTLDNRDSTRFYAENYAQTLHDLGINMNFAPVVDVNTNPECPVIGQIERSFSASPEKVILHSEIFIDTYSNYGIISALKHFPGHGSSRSDSHLGFTDVSSTWSEVELIPYRELMKRNKVDMVMTAHVFSEFWDARFPATLSDNVIHYYLRQEMGFQGVVISDDMCMGAIQDNYTLKSSLELALKADVDLLIFSNNGKNYQPKLISEVFDTIKELVDEGTISEDRINRSFERIMLLKNKYGLINE